MSEVQRHIQELLSLLPPEQRPDAQGLLDPEDLVFALESSSPLPRNLLCALEDVLKKAGEEHPPE